MAVLATIREAIKQKVGVASTDTSFDTEIEADIGYAVEIFEPIVHVEGAATSTGVTLNADLRSFALPTGVTDIVRVEVDEAVTDFTIHAGTVYFIDGAVDSDAEIVIFPLAPPTITTLPARFDLALIYYGVSIFYTGLAGDRRKYNIYVGSAGATANRDIKDSAEFFWQMAEELVDRLNPAGGR